ncbi:MAG: glycosyltransferase family 2 protein [Candidatus Blackburnbacteria bacterium]|nr:glycosyltransferase family 2 protein [Candidatus Blackburnbacteria bacterium]
MRKLLILIPVYNEEKTTEELLKRVFAAKTPGWEKKILVVNDGSTDSTGKILQKLQKKYNFVLATHKTNKGKGAAIKTALSLARNDLARLNVFLTQDADLEYDPQNYGTLLKAYDPNKHPVVYGSRNLGTTKRGYLLCHWTGRALSFIFNTLYSSNITDINTGFKLFRADIIKDCDLQVDGFDFCHEVTAKILKRGYKIKEVPITYNPRSWEEGKKVRPKDAWLDLWTTLKYRL